MNITKFSNEECLFLSSSTDVQYYHELISFFILIILNIIISLKNEFLVESVQINSHKGTEMCQTKGAFKRTIWLYPLQ